MEKDLCASLLSNDTAAIKSAVNNYLTKIDARKNRNDNTETIRQWIAAFPCIDTVAAEPQVHASDPPIQRFTISMKDESGNSIQRSIGVRMAPNKYTSDLK